MTLAFVSVTIQPLSDGQQMYKKFSRKSRVAAQKDSEYNIHDTKCCDLIREFTTQQFIE